MSEIKEHDEYLSDIHVENLPIEKKENRICVSQIEFILPVGREKRCKSELFDSDGDLVVNRPEKHKFMIEHNLETDLDNVGKILKWLFLHYLATNTPLSISLRITTLES